MDKFRPPVVVMDDVREEKPMVETYPNLCRMANELIDDVLACADGWEKNLGKEQAKREIRIIRLATRRGAGHSHCLQHIVETRTRADRILVIAHSPVGQAERQLYKDCAFLNWEQARIEVRKYNIDQRYFDYILIDAPPLEFDREMLLEFLVQTCDFKVMVVLG